MDYYYTSPKKIANYRELSIIELLNLLKNEINPGLDLIQKMYHIDYSVRIQSVIQFANKKINSKPIIDFKFIFKSSNNPK